MFTPRNLARGLGLGTLLLAASCNSEAGTSSGRASQGTTTSFGLQDLAGDWSGTSLASHALDPTVLCLRHDGSGWPVEVRLGSGESWDASNSFIEAEVDAEGGTYVAMERLDEEEGALRIEMYGVLDAAEQSLDGWFLISGPLFADGVFAVVGTGPGTFTEQEHVEGGWYGGMAVEHGHDRPSTMVVLPDASILSGRFGEKWIDEDYQIEGVMAIDDDSLGVIREVCIKLSDGSALYCDYVLADPTGSWLNGAGVHEVFGEFVLRLERRESGFGSDF